jgi:hypothetical protein
LLHYQAGKIAAWLKRGVRVRKSYKRREKAFEIS